MCQSNRTDLYHFKPGLINRPHWSPVKTRPVRLILVPRNVCKSKKSIDDSSRFVLTSPDRESRNKNFQRNLSKSSTEKNRCYPCG